MQKARAGLKVVLIDIDDTLFGTKAFSKKARMNALRAMKEAGMKAGVARAYGELMAIVDEYGPNYHDHIGKLLVRLGEGRNSRMIAAGIAAYHNTKTRMAPFSETVRAVRRMRRAGLKVYAATEGRAVKQWDKLVRLGMQDEIDGAFISEELGVAKSPAYYGKIARKLKTAPGRMLMLGDRVSRDYVPARRAGLRALLVLRKGRKREKDVCCVRNLREGAEKAIEMM